MSEDRRASRPEPEQERSQRKAQRPRRRRASIASYLVILFAVAFLLLLMAYFQQQRQNDQTNDALKTSVSAVSTIQNMMEENETLRQENAQLLAQVNAMQLANQEMNAKKNQAEEDSRTKDGALDAMDWFWQINEAYVRGRYTQCRELIQTFEALSINSTPLKALLPTESVTDNGRFSPKDRYQEIYDALY